MRFIKLSLCAAVLAALASAATYHVTLLQPSVIGGKEIKPGDYRIEVNGDRATIKTGKDTIEAPVKVENSDNKISQSAVRYDNSDGKYRVQEILVGGTHTKLVFGETQGSAGGR